MTAAELAERIGYPLDLWPGKCTLIVAMALDAGVYEGRGVYGHYRGPVMPGSMFYKTRIRAWGWASHGWIVTPYGIIDPTRWVFENADPYVYEGPHDPDRREYDEGGNVWRREAQEPAPAATFGEDRTHDLLRELPEREVKHFVAALVGETGSLTMRQVAWIANLSLDVLGEHAFDVYAAITCLGQGALIPYDNARGVLGDDLYDELSALQSVHAAAGEARAVLTTASPGEGL